MLSFKQFVIEAKNWTVSTQKAERIVHKTLRMNPEERENTIKSGSSDESLASVVANAIHGRITRSLGGDMNDKLYGVRHVGGTKVASRRRKKILGIPYFTTGRPVEDIGATTNIDGEKVHHLIDLKLGSNASAGSWSARKINMLMSGISRESQNKSYKEKSANKQIVPSEEIRSTTAKSDIARRLNDYFNTGIQKEANNRQLDDNIPEDKKREILQKEVSSRQESIVKQIMNVHERIPSDVKRHQVNVDSKSITIHDPDDAWNFFHKNFKPTTYSFSHKGGQTVNVYAHNDDGQSFHLASIGVKHRRGNKQREIGDNMPPESLDYNIKNKLFKNLIKKYGYNAHTYIQR